MCSTFDYRSPSLPLQICSFSVVLFAQFTPICHLRQRMPVIAHPSSRNYAERHVLNQSSIVRSIWQQYPSSQPSTSRHRLTRSACSSITCISTTVRAVRQREDLWIGALRSTCSRSPPPAKLHQLSIHIIYEALMMSNDSPDAGGWLQPPERSVANSPEKQSENVERRCATAAPHSDMTANDPAFWARNKAP
eukprot:COSAG02_NODE_10204_length_1995_cov_126.393987_2_plen_192_part_00